MRDNIPAPDDKKKLGTETDRRRLLKGLGAAGGVAAYELLRRRTRLPKTTYTTPNTSGESGSGQIDDNKQEKTKNKIDFSWIRNEHIEDILGMLYHGHNIGGLAAHATDKWKNDKYGNAIIEKAPWGGTYVIIYNFHGSERNAAGFKADVLTFESVLTRRLGEYESRAPKPTFAQHRSIVRDNISTPSYIVDCPERRWRAYLSVIAIALTEVIMAKTGAGMLIDPKTFTSPSKLALATYLTSGVGTLGTVLAGHSVGGKVARVSRVATKTFGDIPTVLLLLMGKLRNVLAAEKNEYIARLYSEKKESPVNLATVWGAAHAGLETETLRTSEERMATIRRWKPLIELVHGTAPERSILWTCPRVVHSEDEEGNLFDKITPPHIEISQLKSLFSKET